MSVAKVFFFWSDCVCLFIGIVITACYSDHYARGLSQETTGIHTNAGSMLGQRRRRWPNIEPALGG